MKTPLFIFASVICSASFLHAQEIHFGNGIRNGWVDQTTAVIWTRSTAKAELDFDGKKFRIPKGEERKRAQNSKDPELQLKVQLPEGAKLEDMECAMPGVKASVYLAVWPVDNSSPRRYFKTQTTKAENDFCVQWKVDNLKPGTQYLAEVGYVREGIRNEGIRSRFRTAPSSETPTNLKFCMTTCHDFPRRDFGNSGHRIYPSMGKIKPDFMVHAGDIEYYDKPYPLGWTIGLMRFHWNRFFALPANRKFYNGHTSYFMKDDHDTLKNDCWVGQRYGSVTFEQGVKLFNEEQFPSNSQPYKTIRWGKDLQIWLLEGRDFRSPNNQPDGPDKTIFGAKQKKWLFETVEKSDAKFKIIFSPTPWLGPDRGGKRDNHANKNFQHEGEELRAFLAKQENVFVLCGDRHWQYVTHLKDQGLWEFGCGPGSQEHQLGWRKGDLREQHEFLRVDGGFLSGEIVSKGREVRMTLRHHDVDGRVVNEVEFK